MKNSLKKMLLSGLALTLGLTGAVGGVARVASASYVPSKVLTTDLTKAEIEYIPNITYAQVATFESSNTVLQMDVLKPLKEKPMPAVVFVTGGGFIAANRARLPQLRMRLAESGYVVASIAYRVAPMGRFPQPLEDVKSAIRYVKAHAAQFNIDPDQVAVVGDSAGGYLSAFAAVTNGTKKFNVGDNLDQSSKVVAGVDIYGLSDLTKVGADYSAEVQALHDSAGASEALWVNGVTTFGGVDGGIPTHEKEAAAANPINYITSASAPMLLMHGTKDSLVSPSQTDLLFQALQEKGIESERYELQGADHADSYWVQDNVMDVIVKFLDRYVTK